MMTPCQFVKFLNLCGTGTAMVKAPRLNEPHGRDFIKPIHLRRQIF
jgi:hypothetical protein